MARRFSMIKTNWSKTCLAWKLTTKERGCRTRAITTVESHTASSRMGKRRSRECSKIAWTLSKVSISSSICCSNANWRVWTIPHKMGLFSKVRFTGLVSTRRTSSTGSTTTTTPSSAHTYTATSASSSMNITRYTVRFARESVPSRCRTLFEITN